MTKPVVVADAALRELERAAKWYEQQREGLGDELIDTSTPSSSSYIPERFTLEPSRASPPRTSAVSSSSDIPTPSSSPRPTTSSTSLQSRI